MGSSRPLSSGAPATAAAERPPDKENETLRARLAEVEETLRAILNGEVDALVVETAGEDRVFTLKSADQTYRLMVEEMRKGAATLSAEGVVLYCNSFLAALLEVPVEALLGASLSSHMAEPHADTLAALLLAPVAAGGVSRSEISFRKGAGSVLTEVALSLLPLEGAPVICMVVTDLTERQRGEDERAQLAREQAARVAAEAAHRKAQEEIERRKAIEESLRQAERERTLLLESERAARTQAEDANRLKDEFLATLSHELRTPLSAILSWSHVLRQPGLDQAVVSRAVEAIDRNARGQAQLVADILDVSRIVKGEFHMSFAPVRLGEVVELAAETVRPAARAKEIRLELTVDAAADSVSGDANRLQQVIWNLLSNAIRFAPTGGRVQVRVRDAGPCVELSVIDDGCGIDPEFLPYVFDRFRQADSSSTRRHAGLGLGLAIVRHLVELHGGTVSARNGEGEPGAVFTLKLPRPQTDGCDPTPESEAAPVEASAPAVRIAPSLEDVSILLVDDDVDTREAMAIGLVRFGARVAIASSAREALIVLGRERPDVLVADVGMPGEDGHSLLQKIRALPAERGGATPAIALTAYASEQDREEALRVGFQLHVSKPVTPLELAAAVASLASRRP